ncbi:MAG TPA: hypothetical protein VIU15_02735 [Streptomyces sp.]
MAAIGAGLWGTWSNRTRKSRGDGPELDGYARFRAAMERPLGREATFKEPAPLRTAAFEDAHKNIPPRDDTFPTPALESTAPTN